MNTPHQNIINTLKGKSVLFLENDNSLNNGVDEIQRIINLANIEHEILFGLHDVNIDKILAKINAYDCIVFMTQWSSEVSHMLYKHIKQLETKKIIIEVYMSEPTWYYANQHGTIHDVYIFSYNDAFNETEFYKLTEDPYWDYKNKFDK